MGIPTASGKSLWLMPDGAAGETLTHWIERLAERFRAQPFPPHVTLLGAIEGEVDALRAAAGRAAAQLAPFTVHVDGLGGTDEPFRCVFVEAVEAAPLAAAHRGAAAAFGRDPDPGYAPHLSLVYGSLLPEQKHGLSHEVGPEVDLRFDARRLHLWSTDGPVAAWRELGAFDFGRG